MNAARSPCMFSQPVQTLPEEKPEEVYTTQWDPAPDICWQLEEDAAISQDDKLFQPVQSFPEEQPEEVYSVQWNLASDMYWQLDDRNSTFYKYLCEYGPQEFPAFKKRLKHLRKTLARLTDGDPFPDAITNTANEKPSNLRALIDDVASHVSMATVRLKQPGLRKFFADGIGKHVLASVERKHSILIEILGEKPEIVVVDELQTSLTSALAEFDEKLEDIKKQISSPEVLNEEIPADSRETSWKRELGSSECTWLKNTQICVCVGDLTKEMAEAVLMMNNDKLELKKGGELNKNIALAAGPSVQKECKNIISQNGAQLPGNAVVTGAGNLSYKNLIHVIAYPGPPQILDLQLGVKTGLKLADEKGLGSIALPAIGAGAMGLSLTNSARVLSGGILSFLECRPRSIREIRIVLYDESLTSTFSQEIKNEFAPIQALEGYSPLSVSCEDEDCIAGITHSGDAFSEGCGTSAPSATAEFRVYGRDRKCVTNAANSLRGIFVKHCTVQRITHKLVPRLIQSSWAWLRDLASKHDTDIRKEAHNSTVIVDGNSDDVSLVVSCIWQEIGRLSENQYGFEKRKLMAQYVRWHYVILDREIAFNEKVSSTIEEAFNNKSDGVALFMNNYSYKVDFKTMTVVSCGYKYPPLRLSRKLLTETGVLTPDSWSTQPCFTDGTPLPVAVFPVFSKTEVEYKSVADMFYSTGGYGTIVSISRIQNPCLYKQYTTYRQEVERANSRSGRIIRNELQLFHGTKEWNVSSINKQGFNRTFCGTTNGAAYGNGVYFASRASYSMGFATPDSNGLQHMYLARVVVGFYALGSRGLLVPPPLCPQQPEVLFDSVVDNTANPSIFVVFRDAQCYPEYLITFKTT